MQSTFGTQLQRVMGAAGIKQTALGDAANLSQSAVSRLIHGHRPKLEELNAIAKALGVSRFALVGGTDIAGEYPDDCIVTLDADAQIKWLAYFASALTNVTPDERELIFREAAVVREACEDVRAFLYEPRFYTDPINHKNVRPEDVYATDHAQVSVSSLVILHARHPSFGAGQELEVAKNTGIPVVLLEPRGGSVSRMVLGTTARLHQVYFGTLDELRVRLTATLTTVVTDLVDRHTPAPRVPRASSPDTFAERLRYSRSALRIDQETLARRVGLSQTAIQNFESGLDRNPSLTVLILIAQVLQTTVAHLAEGVPARIEDRDPVHRQSRANLAKFAADNHVPYDEAQTLWDAEDTNYRTHRFAVAEARSSPVTVEVWLERYEELHGRGKAKQRRLLPDD